MRWCSEYPCLSATSFSQREELNMVSDIPEAAAVSQKRRERLQFELSPIRRHFS
jgi:hypothetical protein